MSMDTTVLPSPANFDFIVDDTVYGCLGLNWQNPTTLRMGYIGPAPTTSGVARYHSVDVNLRSADHIIAVAPQTVQFFP